MRAVWPWVAVATALSAAGVLLAFTGSPETATLTTSTTRTYYSLPVIPQEQHRLGVQEYNWDALNGNLSDMAASSATFYMAKAELDLYLASHNAPNTGLNRQLTGDDVVVILKTSEECKSRVAGAKQSWMAWAKHIYIISNQADSKLGIMTFPPSENFTFGDDMVRGHHYYHFLGYLWDAHPEIFSKPYFVLCDDDTWVNMPLVLRFLQPYSPELKVMFTGLQINTGKSDGCHEYNQNCSTTGIGWGGGGAGVLMTRAGMRLMASMVRSGACPWLSHDDLSWARCAASGALVPQVLSEAFDMAARGHNEYHPPLAMLTIHKVFPECKAESRDEEVSQLKRWSCSAARRYRVNPTALPDCANPQLRDVNTYYHGNCRRLHQVTPRVQ